MDLICDRAPSAVELPALQGGFETVGEGKRIVESSGGAFRAVGGKSSVRADRIDAVIVYGVEGKAGVDVGRLSLRRLRRHEGGTDSHPG